MLKEMACVITAVLFVKRLLDKMASKEITVC
jgi:hypothetical protein